MNETKRKKMDLKGFLPQRDPLKALDFGFEYGKYASVHQAALTLNQVTSEVNNIHHLTTVIFVGRLGILGSKRKVS